MKYSTLPRRTVGPDRRARGNWLPALATKTNIAIREENHDPFARRSPAHAVCRRPWHYSRGNILATRGAAIHRLAVAKHVDRSAAAGANDPVRVGRSAEVGGSAKACPSDAAPIATAADKIPVDQLKAPKGFKIDVYVTGMVNARSLREGDKGTIFVSSRLSDKIYAITEKNGKREAKPVLTGLFRPNGIVFHNGTLYIAELSQVSKVENIEDKLDQAPKPTVIYSDLPKDEAHGWK